MKMQAKDVQRLSDNYDKVLKAVRMVSEPVKQTMGPKGGNVVVQKDGGYFVTNDGVSIAREVCSDDNFEQAILTILNQSALRTNVEAGDGTSTTVLLGSILLEHGIGALRRGVHHKEVTEKYSKYANKLLAALKEKKQEAKTDKIKKMIATISANNDTEVAEDAVKIFNSIGLDGRVVLEPSTTGKTEIRSEIGFFMNDGFFKDVFINNPRGITELKQAAVFITNRRLYHQEEAETILSWCLDNNKNNVVIVAKDFLGKALPFFIANNRGQKHPDLNILLVKNTGDDDVLEDLASYLDGHVVLADKGKIVNNLTSSDFCQVDEVISFKDRTLFKDKVKIETKRMKERLVMLRTLEKDLKEGAEKNKAKARIASLTSGVVTARIGGATPVEMQEKIYRYEDSVSAVRSAVAHGCLVGGGVAILRAHNTVIEKDGEFDDPVFNAYASANMRQIAENAGVSGDKVVRETLKSKQEEYGYNVRTGRYENLMKAGVIDPYYAEELAINNSVSIANAILGSQFIITEKQYDESKTSKKN
jgi:chaperonin GroEL